MIKWSSNARMKYQGLIWICSGMCRVTDALSPAKTESKTEARMVMSCRKKRNVKGTKAVLSTSFFDSQLKFSSCMHGWGSSCHIQLNASVHCIVAEVCTGCHASMHMWGCEHFTIKAILQNVHYNTYAYITIG